MSTEELRRLADLRALAQSALPIQGLPEGFSSGGSVTLDPATLLRLLDRIDALERALGEVAELRRLALSTRPIVKANNRAAIHEHLGDLEEAAARAALSETS